MKNGTLGRIGSSGPPAADRNEQAAAPGVMAMRIIATMLDDSLSNFLRT